MRGFFRLQHRKRDAGIEIGDGQIRPANIKDRHQRQDAGDVEDRQRRPEAIAGQHFIAPAQIAAVADDAAMADQAALGIGGGARGVEDHRRGLRVDPVDPRIDLVRGCRKRRCRRHQALRAGCVDTDDRPQVGRFGQRKLLRIAGCGQRGQRCEQAGAKIERVGDPAGGDQADKVGILDEERQFARLIARIDRHGDGAGHNDSEQDFDKFRTRGQQDADMVAGLHAARDERCCPAPRAAVEIGIAGAAVGEHEGGFVGATRCPVTQKRAQRIDGCRVHRGSRYSRV